jgi:hypothetical protein
VVLVVDDTSDTLELYSLYLTGKGFKVPPREMLAAVSMPPTGFNQT